MLRLDYTETYQCEDIPVTFVKSDGWVWVKQQDVYSLWVGSTNLVSSNVHKFDWIPTSETLNVEYYEK